MASHEAGRSEGWQFSFLTCYTTKLKVDSTRHTAQRWPSRGTASTELPICYPFTQSSRRGRKKLCTPSKRQHGAAARTEAR